MKFSVCPFTANIFSSGKPTRALDTLYDVIKSKKRNNNYSEKLIEQVCVTSRALLDIQDGFL